MSEQPVNWWKQIADKAAAEDGSDTPEYGFYANVNPAFAPPRYSQALARLIHPRFPFIRALPVPIPQTHPIPQKARLTDRYFVCAIFVHPLPCLAFFHLSRFGA